MVPKKRFEGICFQHLPFQGQTRGNFCNILWGPQGSQWCHHYWTDQKLSWPWSESPKQWTKRSTHRAERHPERTFGWKKLDGGEWSSGSKRITQVKYFLVFLNPGLLWCHRGGNEAPPSILNTKWKHREVQHLLRTRLRGLSKAPCLCFCLERYELIMGALATSSWSQALVGSHMYLWWIKIRKLAKN